MCKIFLMTLQTLRVGGIKRDFTPHAVFVEGLTLFLFYSYWLTLFCVLTAFVSPMLCHLRINLDPHDNDKSQPLHTLNLHHLSKGACSWEPIKSRGK